MLRISIPELFYSAVQFVKIDKSDRSTKIYFFFSDYLCSSVLVFS